MRKAILTLGAALALSGCALLLGKGYERMDPVPGSMGVIYIYSGKITSLQNVHIDKEPDTDGITHTISMVKRGYYPYVTMPGLVRVLSGPEAGADCLLVPVQTNSQHWVRVTNKQPRLVSVAQDEAEREIGGHRQISQESMSRGAGNYSTPDCTMVEANYL